MNLFEILAQLLPYSVLQLFAPLLDARLLSNLDQRTNDHGNPAARSRSSSSNEELLSSRKYRGFGVMKEKDFFTERNPSQKQKESQGEGLLFWKR
tara:strand:- start:1262 stop:1546 length:285 start_codon:yes stop_codon:yes gene_type:complete